MAGMKAQKPPAMALHRNMSGSRIQAGWAGKVSAAQVAPYCSQGVLAFGTDVPDLHAEGEGHTQGAQINGYGFEYGVFNGVARTERADPEDAHGLEGGLA